MFYIFVLFPIKICQCSEMTDRLSAAIVHCCSRQCGWRVWNSGTQCGWL